jgi:hypothetical protein
MTTTYQHFSLANTELWLPHTNISPLQTQSYDYHIPTFLPYKHRAMTTTYHTNISLLQTQLCVCKGEMLVCSSHSSVFVREKCWYVVVIALFVREKCWTTELWLPHTNISLLQRQSYDYHILTFLSYKHRAMTTTYQHFSLTNTELWLPSHSSVFVREKFWYVVVIALSL